MSKKKYSVFVGGVEVNEKHLSERQAKELAAWYKDRKYEDVVIEEIVK